MVIFTGFHYHKVDAKGNVSLPKVYRDALEDKVVLTMSSKSHQNAQENKQSEFAFVKIMTMSRWQNIVANRHRLKPDEKRQLLGWSQDVEIDKVGRIRIPQGMRKSTKTEEGMDVCIVGNDDVIEIWNREMHEESMSATLRDIDQQKRIEAFEQDIGNKNTDLIGDARAGEDS